MNSIVHRYLEVEHKASITPTWTVEHDDLMTEASSLWENMSEEERLSILRKEVWYEQERTRSEV